MIAFARSHFAAICIGATAAWLAGCSAMQPPIGALARSQSPAAPKVKNGPCVYLLSTGEASNLSHTQIVAPNCYFYINDTANMSYSTITAAKILYSGPPPNEMGAMFPEATPAPGPTVNDPCPTIPGCSYLAHHAPSTVQCKPGGNYNGVTLSPGCYNALQLSGIGNKLKPGLYVINGQFHVDNATISGSGVTIYLTANVADTNFSNSTLTLSAPKSGKYNRVLFYRPPGQSAAINFSNCTCDFTGILYFPTTQVDYANTGDNYQLLIFGQANLSDSEGLRFGPP